MTVVLDDSEVLGRLTPAESVRVMREAMLATHRGELHAPARTMADLGQGRMLFTAGRWVGRWYGYRSYDTFAHDSDEARDDQLVAVYDDATGQLLGLVIGAELGRRRTGALGGVAVDALAATSASIVGLIGTGSQAWTQLWAVAAVRSLDRVRVFSRNERRRREFAERVGEELGVWATATSTARAAVDGAEIVILATSSSEPVIEAGWLASGCHVSTLGPKQRGRSEFSDDLLDSATIVATDSVAQLGAYHPPALANADRHADRVVALGAVVAGDAPGRRSDSDVTVYLSVGLAGTEVALAADLLAGRSEEA